MGNHEFLNWCKQIVADYTNNRIDKTDSMYYEITYNDDKQETYVDAYKKWENFVVKT